MSARQIRSRIGLPGIIQLAGGVVTALVAFGICTYIFVKDASREWPPLDRTTVKFFLLLVAPEVLVLVGCYLQTIRRKPWAVALVFIGVAGNSIVVGLFVGFLFLYTGNIWGQRAVVLDLIAVTLTFGMAIANLILWAHARTNLSTNLTVEDL